jgi:hypothetical protein
MAPELAVQLCQCFHGAESDDAGKLLDPCPGGHSPEVCSRESAVELFESGEPEPAHLCRHCAAAWIAEGDWMGFCECVGCWATHHKSGNLARIAYKLFHSVHSPPDDFELVCRSCANLRTGGADRALRTVILEGPA